MPKTSPFKIILSHGEQEELESRVKKYTLPYYEVIRAQMILLAAKGWENRQIAEHLNTKREVVSMWRKRFYEQRLEGLEDRTRPGRPRAFPPSRRL